MSEEQQLPEYPPRGGNTVLEITTGNPSNPRTFKLSSARHRFMPFLNGIELILPELLKTLEPEAPSPYATEQQVRFAASNTVLTLSDYVLIVDCTAGNVVVSLPSATNMGVTFVIVKKDSTGNTVTVSTFGNDTIEGMPSKILGSQWAKCVLTADGVSNFIDEAAGGV